MAYVYKYKDEELRFSKETYDKLKALPVEDRRNALERGYNSLKGRKQEAAQQEEVDQRSSEAKRILSRFDQSITHSATPSGSYLDMATRGYGVKPGLGDGPKEPYIAAALNVPEQDLDTTSGLPAGLRAKVSLLADSEARKVFLEKQTGGTLESLNINGTAEDYIRFPNGKVVQVDETGFSAKDLADISGEILPTSAEVITGLGLAALSLKTGGLSAIAAGTAAPAAGALTREFQSIFAQEVLGFAPEVEVDFIESASRVAIDTVVGAIIEVPLTVAGRRVVKRFPESRQINKVASASADSADEFNKKLDVEIKAGELEPVPVIPITKEGLEYQATARPETMIRSIQKTQDNLNSVPEVIFGGPQAAKKVIQKSARREINNLDEATQRITNKIEILGEQNVKNLTKDLADQRSMIEFSLTGGSQPLDELSKAAGKRAQIIIAGVDSKISSKNKELYDSVFESAINEQVSIPVKTVVDAIRGKTVAKTGKKKLDPASVDAVISELFLKVIQKRGKEFKTLNDLKADDFFKNGKVTFSEIDLLWKTNKQIFGGSATSKNAASRNLDKRLNNLRNSSVKNAPQTKAALEEADVFYRDINDFQKRNISKQFFKGKKSKGGNIGLKSLVSSKNSLKSAEDIRFVREQVKKFGDPEDIRLFNQSLRYQVLNEKNFIDGVPKKLGREEKILFREVFGDNEANFLFNFAEAASAAGKKLSLEEVEEVGNIFLRQGRSAGRKAVDNLIQVDKLQKRRDNLASEALFSRSDSMEIINGDLSFAGKRINNNVSPESVSTFVSQLNNTEKRAFKKYTIASLIENQGNMQGQTGLFDAGAVLKTLENNPEKYKTIFGSDVGKVKSYLKIFDNYSVDLKRAREAASGQLHYGYRTVLSPETGQLRLYTNFLLNLSPTRWKGRASSLILASAFTSGKFNPKLSTWTLPDLEYNEAYITKLLQSMLIAENSVDLVLGQDDMLQRMTLEWLGLSNMDRPNSSNQAPLQELYED